MAPSKNRLITHKQVESNNAINTNSALKPKTIAYILGVQ